MATWIETNIDSSIATILVNKPKALNALDTEVMEQLHVSIDELLSSNVRCLVLRSAGSKAFIAGADIKQMLSLGKEGIADFVQLGSSLATKISTLPFPTVARVDGFCLGGGLEMALACDFIVCTESAVLGLPEMSLGLIPGFGGTQRLKNRVNKSLYQKIVYLNSKLGAKEALDAGLIDYIYSEEELGEFLVKLKDLPTESYAKAKACYQVPTSLASGLELEAKSFELLFETNDTTEGLSAFLEKRKADFKGN